MWKKIVVGTIFLFIVIVLGLLYGSNPFAEQRTVRVHILENMTGQEIAEVLAAKDVIYNAEAFRGALYLTGAATSLQEGMYDLKTNMSLCEAIEMLRQGRVKTVQVVIPEGFNVRQIAKRLAEHNIVDEYAFIEVARSYPVPDEMKADKPVDFSVEGFLFPDTYELIPKLKPERVLELMNEESQRYFTPERKKEIRSQGMSVHDFITLASLVEKEAKYPEDRYLIAAVFKKRLAINMPLQSCASIQYILGEAKPILSIADTRIPSAYNTYINPGLPPGPIASPGKAAMDAVLHAPPTEYLFFAADEEGRHHFAKTYEEHQENVERIDAQAK